MLKNSLVTNAVDAIQENSWLELVAVDEGFKNGNEKENETLSRMEEIHWSILVYREANTAQWLPPSLISLEIMLTTGTVPVLQDGWGGDFQYDIEGQDYILISAGNDRRHGSDDDLVLTYVKGVKRKGRVQRKDSAAQNGK